MVGTRHPFLPIPVIPEHTRYIKAGAITIGVGYRLLNDKIASEYLKEVGMEREYSRESTGYTRVDDGGVSIFIFGEEQGELVEHFRFDVFDAQPHYHYSFQKEKAQERVLLDTAVIGDPRAWALDCLRNRMPSVLAKAGAHDLAARVDTRDIDDAMPQIVAALDEAAKEYRQATGKA